MRVITPAAFKVYTFNELPKNVQSAVLDANRFILTDEDYWYDFIYDDFQNVIAPLFGIEVGLDDKGNALINFQLHQQGAGARFAGSWEQTPDVLQKVSEHSPQDKALQEIAGAFQREYEASKERGDELHATMKFRPYPHYYHEGTVEIEVFNEHGDELEGPNLNRGYEPIDGALRGLMTWLFERIESEWDFCVSDERLIEYFLDPVHEFRGDGEIFIN